jgi:hypothetical protein
VFRVYWPSTHCFAFPLSRGPLLLCVHSTTTESSEHIRKSILTGQASENEAFAVALPILNKKNHIVAVINLRPRDSSHPIPKDNLSQAQRVIKVLQTGLKPVQPDPASPTADTDQPEAAPVAAPTATMTAHAVEGKSDGHRRSPSRTTHIFSCSSRVSREQP